MRGAKNLLKIMEDTMQSTQKMPFFSQEKVYLESVEQFVPRSLDWRKVFTSAPKRQSGGDCVATNVYNVLENFGTIINKRLDLPYEDLLYKDFRNTPAGGSIGHALEHCMLNGVYSPCDPGEDDFNVFGNKVPLRGYLRLIPCNEEYFIRGLAQQQLLVSIHAGEAFQNYRGGVFMGEKTDPKISGPLLLNHCMMAVAYNDTHITLQNSWKNEEWGEKGGFMTIPRGYHPRGVSEVYTHCLIPYMDGHMTAFNERLIKMQMHVSRLDFANYHPRDLKTMFFYPTYPIDLKLSYFKDLIKYWKHLPGNEAKD